MVSYVRGKSGGRLLTNQQIVDAYVGGENSISIGLRANCDSVTVLNICRAAGVPIRPRGPSVRKTLALTDEEIIRLYTQTGLSGPTIADRAGCTTNTIYRVLRLAGVTLRDSGSVSKAMASAARARWQRKGPA